MNTSIELFKDNAFTQLRNIDIQVMVYERDDDGFLLECQVDTPTGRKPMRLCVDFREWQHLLGLIKDKFQAGRLQQLASEMVLKVDWVAELSVTKILGKKVLLSSIAPLQTDRRLRA